MALNFDIGRVELSDNALSGPVVEVRPSSGSAGMPGGISLDRAVFRRVGQNLGVESSGMPEVLVSGFFDTEEPVDLVFPEGMRVFGLMATQLADPQPGSSKPVGNIVSVSGSCTILRAGGEGLAAKGEKIFAGDILATGEDGIFAFSLSGRTAVAMGGGGRLGVHILGDGSLSILHGVFVVRALKGGEGRALDTTVASVSLQEGACGIDVSDAHNATIVALGNPVDISVVNGRGSRVLTAKDLFTTVGSYDQEPSAPDSIDPKDAMSLFAAPLSVFRSKSAESKQGKPVDQPKSPPPKDTPAPYKAATELVAEDPILVPQTVDHAESGEDKLPSKLKAKIKPRLKSKRKSKPEPKAERTPKPEPKAEPQDPKRKAAKKAQPSGGNGTGGGYFIVGGREAAQHGGIGTDFLYGEPEDEVVSGGGERGAEIVIRRGKDRDPVPQ